MASSALPDPNHDRNGTKQAQEVETVLQYLKRSQKYSSNRLNEKASKLPFSVLKDLCPLMNKDRGHFYDDYRLMGEYMGLKNEIIESAVPDHTQMLLELYGSKFGGTVGHVMAIFSIIERNDAFNVLENYCLNPGNS